VAVGANQIAFVHFCLNELFAVVVGEHAAYVVGFLLAETVVEVHAAHGEGPSAIGTWL
jgi:hypothetical protein